MPSERRSPIARLAVLMIRGYQRVVSPTLGRNCRFAPSCSTYAAEAITLHGATRGTGLAIRRLARCQPLTEAGYDPVPERI